MALKWKLWGLIKRFFIIRGKRYEGILKGGTIFAIIFLRIQYVFASPSKFSVMNCEGQKFSQHSIPLQTNFSFSKKHLPESSLTQTIIQPINSSEITDATTIITSYVSNFSNVSQKTTHHIFPMTHYLILIRWICLSSRKMKKTFFLTHIINFSQYFLALECTLSLSKIYRNDVKLIYHAGFLERKLFTHKNIIWIFFPFYFNCDCVKESKLFCCINRTRSITA